MDVVSSHPVCQSSVITRAFNLLIVGCIAITGTAAVEEAGGSNGRNFTFNGFSGPGGKRLVLDGMAVITPGGLLQLTNYTKRMKGHAFFSIPFQFKHAAAAGSGAVAGKTVVSSFSTTYAFAIVSEYPDVSAHGIAFVVSPTKDLSRAMPNQYLGLFNTSNNGNATNHILAVELDTVQSSEFRDIDNNHVGIDVNGLVSNVSHTAGWYSDMVAGAKTFQNLSLISGDPMQVWVDYDGVVGKLDVRMAPLGVPKPRRTLLSTVALNLSEVLMNSMHVGFSSSTGTMLTSHYVLGWSFAVGEGAQAPPLDTSKLPKVPPKKVAASGKVSPAVTAVIALVTAVASIASAAAVVAAIRRHRKFADVVEDWELEYGPRRYKYRDLYVAANGFKDKELLGVGGFGRVYMGVLPGDGNQKQEVAIKRVSHDSRQGIQEFVAEINSLGQIRHRNLVQLLGYCRREGELLLVYEFMPNGSLDKYLYTDEKMTSTHSSRPRTIDWAMRFHVIKGVASGLLYLHEECNKVVVHRDVKASNVLLDADMNGRLGDFGLARLYDRGGDPRTTRVVGTMGYLAPELSRSGKATPSVDVFAFGAFLLEVACGRRPIEPGAQGLEVLLLDWVAELWRGGRVVDAVDPKLEENYVVHEAEMVLKLGLLCSHPSPAARPCMSQVVQFLYGGVPLQELPPDYIDATVAEVRRTDDRLVSFPSSSSSVQTASDFGRSVSDGR